MTDDIILAVIGAFIFVVVELLTHIISKSLKNTYNKIRFRKIKTYAKSQVEELQEILYELNFGEIESVKENIDIIEIDNIKNLDKSKNFGILQFPKGISKEDVKETIISQLSTISKYKAEILMQQEKA